MTQVWAAETAVTDRANRSFYCRSGWDRPAILQGRAGGLEPQALRSFGFDVCAPVAPVYFPPVRLRQLYVRRVRIFGHQQLQTLQPSWPRAGVSAPMRPSNWPWAFWVSASNARSASLCGSGLAAEAMAPGSEALKAPAIVSSV